MRLPQPSSGAEGPLEPPLTLKQPLGLTVFPARSRETLPVEGALQGGDYRIGDLPDASPLAAGLSGGVSWAEGGQGCLSLCRVGVVLLRPSLTGRGRAAMMGCTSVEGQPLNPQTWAQPLVILCAEKQVGNLGFCLHRNC